MKIIFTEKMRNSTSNILHMGDVYFGKEESSTLLASCIAIAVYCENTKSGGLTHTSGMNTSNHKYPTPKEAIERLEELIGPCGCHEKKYYVIGGTNQISHNYKNAITELKKRDLQFEEIDVLGEYHRKVILNPAKKTLEIYKGLRKF